MKTREIDVWVSPEKDPYGHPMNWLYVKTQGTPIKAKLIIPVEPEVVTIEFNSGYAPVEYMAKLHGKRWKAVFTEIISDG